MPFQLDRVGTNEQLAMDKEEDYTRAFNVLFPDLLDGQLREDNVEYFLQLLSMGMALLESSNPDAALLTWAAEAEFVTPCLLFAAGVFTELGPHLAQDGCQGPLVQTRAEEWLPLRESTVGEVLVGDCLTAYPAETSARGEACGPLEFNLMEALLGQLEGHGGRKFLQKHGNGCLVKQVWLISMYRILCNARKLYLY